MHAEVQQRFVQVCASHGAMRTAEATRILEKICDKYEIELPTESRFKEFVANLNNDLNKYDHNIAFVKYPITKEEFIVFCTLSQKGVRTLNHLTELDLSYFRMLLMTIAVAEEYKIPEIQAINITSQMPEKQLAKNRAESLLRNWKQVGYFHESNDFLYFGPRTVVEFESFLLKCFPDDIKDCSLCKKIVLWDPSCNECGTKFHSECIRKYLIKSSNCPVCQKLWSTSFV